MDLLEVIIYAMVSAMGVENCDVSVDCFKGFCCLVWYAPKTERHVGRQADMQTETNRLKGRQAGRQTDRQTSLQMFSTVTW